jgi:hypothetical protein
MFLLWIKRWQQADGQLNHFATQNRKLHQLAEYIMKVRKIAK